MKGRIALVIFFLVAAVPVAAQKLSNSGLVINGSLVKVTIVDDTSIEKQARTRFRLDIHIQYRNDSDTPLIVLLPSGAPVAKTIEFLSKFSDSGETEAVSVRIPQWKVPQGGLSVPNGPRWPAYDPFPSFVEAIDSPEPPIVAYRFAIIQPGAYYEFRDSILIDDGYKLDLRPSQKIKDLSEDDKVPTSEYPAFRLEYYLSLKGHHKDADFLKKLQQRWKSFGHLVLNGSGDFTLRSNPIINETGRRTATN